MKRQITEEQARKLCEGFDVRITRMIEENRPSPSFIMKLQARVRAEHEFKSGKTAMPVEIHFPRVKYA